MWGTVHMNTNMAEDESAEGTGCSFSSDGSPI